MASLPDLTRTLNLTFGPAHGPLPRSWAMTDTARTPNLEHFVDHLPADTGIIFRHYDIRDRATQARSIIRRAHRRAISVLIAGDPVLALETGADGIHLPSYQLNNLPVASRLRRPRNWITTAAVHNHRDISIANRIETDAVLLSPVFPTVSHPGSAALGVLGFASLCRRSRCPVFALGGLAISTVRRLKNSGAEGIAGIGLFIDTG